VIAYPENQPFRDGRATSLTRLAPDIVQRGLNARQAAVVYGLSTSGFYKARREGKIPGPTLPGKRYDRNLLESDMNRRSGLLRDENVSVLQQWKKNRASSSQRN
jgi:hypothetical protein